MIIVYGMCEENAVRAKHLYAEKYPDRNQPSHSTFLRLSQMLRETGSLMYRNANTINMQQTKTILLLLPAIHTSVHGKYHKAFQLVRQVLCGSFILRNFIHITCRCIRSCMEETLKIVTCDLLMKLPSQTVDNLNVWCGILGNHIIGSYFIDGLLTINSSRHRRRSERILNLFDNTPTQSVRRASAQLQISRNTIWRTLRADDRFAYHYTPVQELLPIDYQKRVEFCNWYVNAVERDNLFSSMILWTDEATFTRRGIFNSHNS
ncbi:hypothetical protein X777_08882, partial [Ooceraea biroi]